MCTMVMAVASIAMGMAASAQAASAQRAAANSQAQQVIYVADNNKKVADYNAEVVENVGDYNATVVENNIDVLENAADDALQRGTDAAAESRLRTKRSNALGRAIQGSSGTQLDTGTNLDLQVQNRMNGEIAALSTMNQAEREAYGYRLDATNEKNRAQGIRYTSTQEAEQIRIGGKLGVANASYAADNYRYAGNLNANTTLISGYANAASQTYDLFASSARNPYSGGR